MLILKIIGSFLLLIFLLAGVLKANPRTHNPDYPPMAEYAAGFIICVISLVGLHYIWV